MVMRNDDSQLNERWVDAGRIEIPPIERQGFEADVLVRDVWEHGTAEEYAPETPDETVPLKQYRIQLLRMNSTDGECIVVEGDRFTIGKSRKADYSIGGNPAISRIHAMVYRIGNDWFLEDQGSLNHTYVDGKRIDEPYKLRNDLMIRFANENFLLTMKEVT